MTFNQIYRTFLRQRGFPASVHFASMWKNEAWTIVSKNMKVDAGAMREAHIRDCQKMAACVANSRADFLPAMMVEQENERAA